MLRRVQENPALAQTLLKLAEKLLDLQPQEALASNEEAGFGASCGKDPRFFLSLVLELVLVIPTGTIYEALNQLFSRNCVLLLDTQTV